MDREYRRLYVRDGNGIIWDEIICWNAEKAYMGQWVGQGKISRISKKAWDRAEKIEGYEDEGRKE